jgi:hypothetical protein
VTDRDLFRPLVAAYLRMSFRGRASQAFAGQLAGRPVGMVWLFSMYVAIGGATVPAARAGADPFTYALITQFMTWTMCGLSLIAEAGDALFAPAEPDVLGHRPVAPNVLLAAKVTVLFAFACSLAFAQNLLPTATIALRESAWAAGVHVVVVALAVAAITAIVTCVYAVAARVVPRERFDDVAAWSQIALAIAFVSIALVVPRSAFRPDGVRIDPGGWLMMALPPAWFAALDALVATRMPGVAHLAAAAVTALGALALLAWGPMLARLADAIAHVQDERCGRRVRPMPSGEHWPLRAWLRDPVERAAFQLATAYLRRDREVRLRLRPSLVVFALLPLSGLVMEEAHGSHLAPLASLCLLVMVPGVAMEALRISSHPVASELFAVVPIAGTAGVFHGVRKAAIWYVLPAIALSLVLALAIVPGGVVLALPGVFALPVLALVPGLFGPYVPLSLPKALGQQAVANGVLLASSTVLLTVLVHLTLAASRSEELGRLYAGAFVVSLAMGAVLRAVIARRGLTTREASPS